MRVGASRSPRPAVRAGREPREPAERPHRTFGERVQPELMGALVVHRESEAFASWVFGAIATGLRGDLEAAQTSHETDQIIRRFVQHDTTAADTLGRWMRAGATPVLRVNAAGILAKLRTPEAACRNVSGVPAVMVSTLNTCSVLITR